MILKCQIIDGKFLIQKAAYISRYLCMRNFKVGDVEILRSFLPQKIWMTSFYY